MQRNFNHITYTWQGRENEVYLYGKKVQLLCFWHRQSSLKPLISDAFRFFALKEKKVHQVITKAQDLPRGEMEIYFGSTCFKSQPQHQQS